MNANNGVSLNDWSGETSFVPFVGEKYWDSRRRLLIVGESHYDPDDDPQRPGKDGTEYREFTRHVVKQYNLDCPGTPKPFWHTLNRLVTNTDDPSNGDVCKAWHQMAYMNYIQRVVGRKGQSVKNSPMWTTGEPALREALRLLRPDHVLVLGHTNWRHISIGQDIKRPISASGSRCPQRDVWWFPHSETVKSGAFATWIYHPSARKHDRDSVEVMRVVLGQLIAFNAA